MDIDLTKYFGVGVLEMRPKLLFDVQFHRHRDGVIFKGRNGTVNISGSDAYRVMRDLFVHLTGRDTISDICAKLEPGSIAMALTLIKSLAAYGCIIDQKVEATALTEDVRQRFAAQIEFIGQFVEEPLRRFERFRKSRVVVGGSGAAAASIVTALARNGAEVIFVDAKTADSKESKEILCHFVSDNPPFRFEIIDIDSVWERADSKCQFDAICFGSELGLLSDAKEMSVKCMQRGIVFIPALIIGEKGFIGPLCKRAGSPCWLCFLMHHCESVDAEKSASVWRAMALGKPLNDAHREDARMASRMIANLAAYEVFKLLVCHLPVDIDGSVLSLDLETLECRRARLLPHPLCPHCSSLTEESDRVFLGNRQILKRSAATSLEQKLRQASVLVDKDVGIIEKFDDDDLAQSPIFQAAASLKRCRQGPGARVFGYSLSSYAEARLSAINSVARQYSARQFDRRRLLVVMGRDAEQSGYRIIRPAEISGALLPANAWSSNCIEWMHGVSLKALEPCLVPGASVYVNSSLNSGIFETTDAGVGIGYSFEEACTDAVRSRVAQECLKCVAVGRLTPRIPRLSDIRDASPDLRVVLVILEQLGLPLRILMASYCGLCVAVAFLPTLSSGGDDVAVGASERPEDAVSAALLDVVAIANGGRVSRPLSYYMAGALGYSLDVFEMHRRISNLGPELAAEAEVYSQKGAFEMVVANLATPDVQAAGLYLVKALMVVGSGSGSAS
jgi:bacteriocin biosynthesis cyclodehydratase domain-containing protein